MKRLLATTAVALIATAGAASAQSVLERVLAQTSALGEVTGIFSNSADNIGIGSQQAGVIANDGTDDIFVTQDEAAAAQAAYDAVQAVDVRTNYSAVVVGGVTTGYQNVTTGEVITPSEWNALYVDATARDTAAATAAEAQLPSALTWAEFAAGTPIEVGVSGTINGSITNVANRIDTATASVEGQVNAIESVTANFGNMSTTVLGAVNTGEIGLGTNQDVQEAISGTSEAVKSLITQVGTQTGQTVLALNSALNTMSINGSISNTFEGVNASVAAISPDVLEIVASTNGAITLDGVDQLLGTMSTTVLGAVNTGTIVSGVNNQVTGTVASITGNSATNMFGN